MNSYARADQPGHGRALTMGKASLAELLSRGAANPLSMLSTGCGTVRPRLGRRTRGSGIQCSSGLLTLGPISKSSLSTGRGNDSNRRCRRRIGPLLCTPA